MSSDSYGRPAPLTRSNITACIRCRQRKKRCDQKLPACTLCQAAGVECVGYDAVAKREIPRSYVLHLEERVAALEIKLQESRTREHGQALSPGSALDSPTTDRGQAGETPHIPRWHSSYARPAFSLIPFSKLMGLDGDPFLEPIWDYRASRDTNQFLSTLTDGLELPPNPLPAKDKAEFFVKAYFEYSNFSSPLLHEPTFRSILESVYADVSEAEAPQPRPSASQSQHNKFDFSSYIVNMVFALGLLTLQKHDPSNVPTLLCDRYYQTALNALNKTTLPHSIEGVQALLLLAQYSYLHPTDFRGWNMIGSALRLSVELGLHREPSQEMVDSLTLDVMRRTFWVAYSMDRNVSIATGRPPCLSDGIITAQYPSRVDDECITLNGILGTDSQETSKKKYIHCWFDYRRLQSEMYTVLHEKPPPMYQPLNYVQWQARMSARLRSWFDQICRIQSSGGQSSNIAPPEVLELTFQRALLYLYRPSPNIPSPSPQAMMALADTSAHLINLYRRFFRDNKLRLFWQAIENLFNAGTALIYCYFHSTVVQEQFPRQDLERLIYTTSTVLWGMVERFPAFKEKRDAFETVASQTLANLSQLHHGNASTSPLSHAGPTTGTIASSHAAVAPERAISVGDSRILSDAELTRLLSAEVHSAIPQGGETLLNADSVLRATTRNTDAGSSGQQMTLDWEAFNGNLDTHPFVWDWEL